MLNRLPLPLRNFLTTLLAFTGGYLAATGASDIMRGRTDPPSIFIILFSICVAAGWSWRRTKRGESIGLGQTRM
jgi:hypothetical protein